jgi:hypothetical protein
MGPTGANRSLAKRGLFSDEIPWSVAGIFSKFGTMNESESSLMLRIRNRSRGVLYRSQPTDTIGGAGC